MAITIREIWPAMVSLWREQRDVAVALIGVFVFLPTLAQVLFIGGPDVTTPDWNGVQKALDYYRENIGPLIGVRLAGLVGSGALLATILAPAGRSVADSIRLAAFLTPSLFVLGMLTQLAVMAGLFVFVIPGLYLRRGSCLLSQPWLANACSTRWRRWRARWS